MSDSLYEFKFTAECPGDATQACDESITMLVEVDSWGSPAEHATHDYPGCPAGEPELFISEDSITCKNGHIISVAQIMDLSYDDMLEYLSNAREDY